MPQPQVSVPDDVLYPYEILKVYFDANQFGVMVLDIGNSTQKEPVTVYLSAFRDPLHGMIAWLEQIAGGQFPAVWEIQS